MRSSQFEHQALDLIGQAIVLLDATDDKVAGARLRHIFAQIQNDIAVPKLKDTLQTPLELMRMALAIIDLNGGEFTSTACALQRAIDEAQGALPLNPGEELDPAILGLFDLNGSSHH